MRYFDMVVMDPQMNGMGEGEYQKHLLIAGWNWGNDFAYSAILRDHPSEGDISLPVARLKEIWSWNLARQRLQMELGDTIFVPRISVLSVDGNLKSAVVWPDGIKRQFPRLIISLSAERALYPTRNLPIANCCWRGRGCCRCLSAMILKRVPGAFVLEYGLPPDDVVRFVRSLPLNKRRVAMIHPANILDRELAEKYISRSIFERILRFRKRWLGKGHF